MKITIIFRFLYHITLICSKVVGIFNSLFRLKYDTVFIRRDRIGDYVLWLGCVQKYKEIYPDEKLTLICSKSNYGIAVLCGVFDDIIVFERKDIFKLLGFRCKKIISPEYSRLPLNEIIAACISANEKITIEGEGSSNPFYGSLLEKKIYTKIINNPSNRISELEINTYFFNQICNTFYHPLYANLDDIRSEKIIIDDYYIINLGASEIPKRWPVQRFVEVAEKIWGIEKKICVLVGAESEIELGEAFLKCYSGKCINMIGKTSLEELISIIFYADFVLTNDTSTVHFCAACSVKCFCIVYGAFWGRLTYYPEPYDDRLIPTYFMCEKKECFGCGLNDPYLCMRPECRKMKINSIGTYPCLIDITSNEVFGLIEDYLC